jgi:ribosomal protein S12 methylthiotransferase accessory factor
MAAGRSWEEACVAGLLEVCERDAFAIMWMNRLSMPRLVVKRGSRLARDLRQALGGSEASVTFVDISNDAGIPVVAAILRHSWLGKPVVSVGASAKRSVEAACRKAFAEAANGYTYIVSQLEAGTGGYSGPDFSGITEWRLHPLVYMEPAMQRELDFMTASDVEREIADPEVNGDGDDDAGRLSALTDRLRSEFAEIAAVDLTTREFAEIGVCVAKVFIPEAVPLHPDHRYTGLAHRRLFEVPRRLGYSATDTSAESLNPLPHPFS